MQLRCSHVFEIGPCRQRKHRRRQTAATTGRNMCAGSACVKAGAGVGGGLAQETHSAAAAQVAGALGCSHGRAMVCAITGHQQIKRSSSGSWGSARQGRGALIGSSKQHDAATAGSHSSRGSSGRWPSGCCCLCPMPHIVYIMPTLTAHHLTSLSAVCHCCCCCL